jgi:hypothetical protein
LDGFGLNILRKPRNTRKISAWFFFACFAVIQVFLVLQVNFPMLLRRKNCPLGPISSSREGSSAWQHRFDFIGSILTAYIGLEPAGVDGVAQD